MSAAIDNLVAVTNPGQDVQQRFLGSLLWYSVHDVRIQRAELEQLCQQTVGSQYLPHPLNEKDSFRRATTFESKGHPHPHEPGKKVNLMVRDVSNGRDTIVRQLVREVVDAQNVRLEYKPIAELNFTNGVVTKSYLATGILPIEDAVLEKLLLNYEMEKLHYNSKHMRDIVNAVINDCAPVMVRPSGGVYFIPRAYENSVNALMQFLAGLRPYHTNGKKSRAWTIPVIDGSDQRDMVSESLEDQVKKETGGFLEDVRELLVGERKITTKLSQRFLERARALKTLVDQYRTLLDDELTSLDSNLELAMAGAMQVMERVSDEAGE